MGLGEKGATIWLWVAFWVPHFLVFLLQIIFAVAFFWLYFISPYCFFKILNQIHTLTTWFLIVLNPFWSVKLHTKTKFPGGIIVMANHLCYIDAWILARMLIPHGAYFIATGFLFKMPILGQVMHMSGHFPVWFKKNEEGKFYASNSHELKENAKDRLKHGGRICVFPEGKLSHSGELLPFKPGFFEVAKEAGAKILPVGMWGNQYLFPPGDQYGTAHPGTVHAAAGDLVDPNDFETIEECVEHIRGEILRLRNGLPNYSEPKPKDLDLESPPDVSL